MLFLAALVFINVVGPTGLFAGFSNAFGRIFVGNNKGLKGDG
jgi:hypothetical protein